MRIALILVCLCCSVFGWAQENVSDTTQTKTRSLRGKTDEGLKGTIDQYRIYSLSRDTVMVDTSLTIKKEYAFNYLRKDHFGLLPFANEGQTYTVLDKSQILSDYLPKAGYTAKLFPYTKAEDIKYYSMATPFTELYFRSTMEQGQSVDALVSVNINPRFNFSLAYRGLRSLGKYINQLSSHGNFRGTFSYDSKNQRYVINGHFMSFDFSNGENGGITDVSNFEDGDNKYSNRARVNVFSRDGKSFMKGYRAFADHIFRINTKDSENNLSVFHQLNYEKQFYEYNQKTLTTRLDNGQTIQHFGASFAAQVNDHANYNKFYNRAGVEFENKTLGHFRVFLEDFRFNYYFGRILIQDGVINDGSLSGEAQLFGGTYYYDKGRWKGEATFSNSFAGLSSSFFKANARYTINEQTSLDLEYKMQSAIPDAIYNQHQSTFVGFNWANDFKNEKSNTISATLNTPWINLSGSLSNFNDKLYFANASTDPLYQIIRPNQYDKSIQYVNLKAQKEFKFWKLGLDNTVMYQQTQQDDAIFNVPKIVTRNTLYYTDRFFKKALFIQTGFTLNYFTKYNADDFNPILNEFFVQNQKEIGGYPMIDFFLNARIRTCRLYLKCEHLNSSLTGYNYLNASNYPYRDFMIRFGLEWNFFK